MAGYFNKEHGCTLPLKTGTFTETEFVLADPADPEGARQYNKLRLPRSAFLPEPK